MDPEVGVPPPSKRSKSSSHNHEEIQQAWDHYRNYIDDDGGEDNDEEGDDGDGGDIDELLELIEILSATVKVNLLSTNLNNDMISSLQDVKSLLPILMSMAYLQLANHAISHHMFDPSDQINKDEENSSPEYYFQQSLHYWPTNPAALSLLANYNRMNSLASVENICDLYVKASEYAHQWRGIAVKFLQSSVEEEEDDMESSSINAKEWVELLVINGALDVDYIGEEDEKEDNEEEGNGNGNGKDETEEEYSTSEVESTASFMSAFLLSILGKHDDALIHLNKFQLTHRIHPNVWKAAQHHSHHLKQSSSITESSNVLFSPRIYKGGNSGVLPTKLYQNLCELFSPDASYWKESDYDHRGYYSYFIDLEGKANETNLSVRDCPTNIIEDVIVNHLLPLAEQTLQDSNTIVGAEWWTHTRAIGANLGHQIHFDTDEALLRREKKVTHPIISSVLYITGGGGSAGPTIVFDQTPNSTNVSSKAWISHPQDNSFLAFAGDNLHGVLPCGGCSNVANTNNGRSQDIHRLTFMVGFWTRDVTTGMGERSLYTPCGLLPPSTLEHSWVMQSQEGYSNVKQKAADNKDTIQQKFDKLPSVSPAWEEFSNKESSEASTVNTLVIPKGLDHRFFVYKAPHCFSDSLFEKEDCF